MENIIRISELRDFVAETLNEIREGVATARASNLMCELPEEVAFSVMLVREFQALEIVGGESSENTEEQGGGSKEIQTGSNSETRVNRSEQDRSERSTGTKKDSQITTGKDVSTANERNVTTGKDVTGSSEATNTNGRDEGVTTNENANGHDQESERETKVTT